MFELSILPHGMDYLRLFQVLINVVFHMDARESEALLDASRTLCTATKP
jgi:hypothetical protein